MSKEVDDALEKARIWEEHWHISQDVRATEKEELESKIKQLVNDHAKYIEKTDAFLIEMFERKGSSTEVEKLQADLKYAKESHERAMAHTKEHLSNACKHLEELQDENKLYIKMIGRLLKTIADMEAEYE